MSYLIEMINVEKTYQLGANVVRALRGVNFTFKQGEFVAVVGQSGAGKTTLVDIIGLLSRPTSGIYKFNDRNVVEYSDNELSQVRGTKIGFVFQSYFLLPRLTALQNVAMPLLYQNISYEEAYARSQAILDKLGVGQFSDHKPTQLSGGQQQRVAVSRALVGNPALILADEPTGALDHKTTGELMELFLSLHKEEGRSILMITHDVELSQRCPRRMRILDGQIFPEEG